jgi:hypothetical protein
MVVLGVVGLVVEVVAATLVSWNPSTHSNAPLRGPAPCRRVHDEQSRCVQQRVALL